MSSRLRTWLLPAFAVLVLLASCSKSNKQGKFVPKDAALVIHLNGESLSSKLPWDEVKKGTLFTTINADSSVPAFMKSILDNPENSGVDIKNDLVIFAQRDSLGGYMAFEGSVKDAVKFKQFNTDAAKEGILTEKDGISFITRKSAVAGWNKEKFVYVVDLPQMAEHHQFAMADDTVIEATPRDLVASCRSIFDLNEKNSLGSDDKFTTLMNTKGDIHMWVNAEKLYKNSTGDFGGMSMLNLDKFYAGNIIVATGNFDNGKISFNYKCYLNKDLKDIFKKYSSGSINEDMIKQIPSKEVAAVFALRFKPEVIKELISLSGMEGLINIGMMAMGFSMDDIIKANKGDIMVAVTDIASKKDSLVVKRKNGKDSTIILNRPEPDILFATAIGDKDAFSKLIKGMKRMSEGRMSSGETPPYNSNDKYFAIGNSKDKVDQYLAGGIKNNFDFLSHITGSPIGGYINLQFIMKAMQTNMTMDSSERIVYDASLKMWDNIYIKGGDYDDGALSYDVEANLLDKNTNSLKQLNQYLGTMAPFMKEKHDKFKAMDVKMPDFRRDSITTHILPPPPMRKKKKNK